MKRTTKYATVAATALALSGLGGFALTSQASAAPAANQVGAVATVDGDTLQQGDQTTPDTAASTAAEMGAESAAEAPEGTTAGETGVSDGPGGHEDPPGVDVQHEGGANEQ